MDQISEEKYTNIQRFYNKKNIFMTGATGFIGKVIIHKLLKSCDVNCIYILIREKKGESIEVRKEKYFESIVFDELRLKNPDFLSKIKAVGGDVSLPNLGLNLLDYDHLTQNVYVIFHLAANVSFDQKLVTAIVTNVGGTQEVPNLAKRCHQLMAAVYASMAYSQCIRHEIEEQFYDPPPDQPREVLSLVQKIDGNVLESVSPKLRCGFPNNYTFSKNLSEHLVKIEGKGLPIAIVRPTMIVCTNEEPIPGWTDNLYGVMSVCVGFMTGVLHVGYGDTEATFDTVPADFVGNCIITAAWDVHNDKSHKIIPIYHVTSGKSNPITLDLLNRSTLKTVIDNPVEQAIWYPFITSSTNLFFYRILSILLHAIPGLFLDILAHILGRKPRLLKIYRKIEKANILMSYFGTRSWIFSEDNTKHLFSKMDENEWTMFNFDINTVNWIKLFHTSYYVMRRHMLNEEPETVKSAKVKLRIFKVLHFSILYTLCGLVLYIIWRDIYPSFFDK